MGKFIFILLFPLSLFAQDRLWILKLEVNKSEDVLIAIIRDDKYCENWYYRVRWSQFPVQNKNEIDISDLLFNYLPHKREHLDWKDYKIIGVQ